MARIVMWTIQDTDQGFRLYMASSDIAQIEILGGLQKTQAAMTRE